MTTTKNKYIKKLEVKLIKSKVKNSLKGQVRTPEDICKTFKAIKDYAVETMIGVYLADNLEVNLYATLAIGTRTTAIVAINEVLDYSIITRSNTFVLIHNHPSGNPTPTDEDKIFIKTITEASEATRRVFLDFIIIGDYDSKDKKKRYWSAFENANGGEYLLGKAF